ncbi:MAG: archease [Candidatus Dependentiae bacterium]|nr:archease [Candidatus Dependentiae bacterium]
MVKDFESLSHTADIKIRVYGDTLEELFRHALIGMFQTVGPQAPDCVVRDGRLVCMQLPQHHSVEVESLDYESLLVDFLSHALYLSDVHNEAYLDVVIEQLTPTFIKASLHGVKITGFEVVEIKAVTYHDLEIKQINGAWQAIIVFDI